MTTKMERNKTQFYANNGDIGLGNMLGSLFVPNVDGLKQAHGQREREGERASSARSFEKL